jgi:hypothetical protein
MRIEERPRPGGVFRGEVMPTHRRVYDERGTRQAWEEKMMDQSGFQLILESQQLMQIEIMARIDAMQAYLGERDPTFWDDWPQYLAAARKRCEIDSSLPIPPQGGEVH